MKISVVIPAYNEGDNISELINKVESGLNDIEHELIVVNDHSTDNTRQLAEKASAANKNIRVIDNGLDKGFANTMKTGFRSMTTEVAVPIMGDLCDDLNTVKEMVAKINDGYDIVCGARYVRGGSRLGGSRFKGFLSRFGGRSMSFLLGLPTHDIANAFKMYKKKALDSISIESKGFEVSMEIPLKAYYLGFKITEVPTVWRERTKGKSNFKVFKLLPSYIKLYLWAIFKRLICLLSGQNLYCSSERSESRTIKNILVIRNDRFGEFLLNIPALRALKETYSGSRLTLAVSPYVRELAEMTGLADEVMPWDNRKHGLLEILIFSSQVRKKKFDLCVILNPSKEFNLITFLAGIPLRLGYDRKWGFLLNKKIEDRKHLGLKHEVEYNLELVGAIGAKTEDKSPSLIPADYAIKGLNIGNFIAIHPWTSDAVKQWPVENFYNLAKKLSVELNMRVVIIGGKEEVDRSKDVFGSKASSIIDMTGKTSLLDLALLLKKSRLLISGDSGPVHLASCLGTPVIALFRSDIPAKSSRRWGPWGSGNTVIERDRLGDITVEEVFVKAREVLK